MTQNQINYWKLQEERRSNLAQEGETKRSNLAKEAETNRSNIAKETETHRSNVANEGVAFGNLSETQRSHQAQESISLQGLAEQARHSQAVEAEEHRSNLARETENMRHNVAMEGETRRSNIANEVLTGTKIAKDAALGTAQLVEDRRQNAVRNNIDMYRATTDRMKLDKPSDTINVYTYKRGIQGFGYYNQSGSLLLPGK